MQASKVRLELALSSDASSIAHLSRTQIEQGLPWSWRVERVSSALRSPDTVVLVARCSIGVAGFAIMYFGDEQAHLNLLAVRPEWRRQGIGRSLLQWLETSAVVAGISVIYLEMRSRNQDALVFYQRLGFRPVQQLVGYYGGRESAIRLAKDLWERPRTRANNKGSSDVE